jgi:hypothetical protein
LPSFVAVVPTASDCRSPLSDGSNNTQIRCTRALLFDEVATKWPELLIEMVPRVPYDLVVASGSDAVEAARAAIQSIPIVGVSSSMGTGGSLARSEALLPIRIGNVDAIPDALERARGEGFDGLIFIASPNVHCQCDAACRARATYRIAGGL